MHRTRVYSTAMTLAIVAMLGLIGIANAQPDMGYQNMSPEQYKSMQSTYADFDKKVEPLRQQIDAKRYELNALHYQGTPRNDPKVQSLIKKIGDLDAKLYTARADFRRQLNDKGIPAYGGTMGRGMMQYDDCGCR